MAIPISRPAIGEEEIRSVTEVLKSGMLAQGKRVGLFEKEFASRMGRRFGVAVSSGTSALQLALEAAGTGRGDEVITTPFSFIATANCIVHCGARPVFADIDPITFNIDPGDVENAITEKTKAVIAVHLYGNPCNMEKIEEVCSRNGLILIEDCAQATGAEYKGRPVGGFGEFSCFSFYPTKNMVTGEGGMILTDDSDMDRKLRILRNQGQSGEYEHVVVGYNHRMTEMAAAIGLEQIRKLDRLNESRIKNAQKLTEMLKGVEWLETPKPEKNSRHVFNQYTIRIKGKSREKVIEALKRQGIGSKIYYPRPIHMQPAYLSMGFREGEFPESERAAKEVLSIPVHPGVSLEGIEKIAGILKGL